MKRMKRKTLDAVAPGLQNGVFQISYCSMDEVVTISLSVAVVIMAAEAHA